MTKTEPILPDQQEIETRLTDILEQGDRKVIAHHGRFHYDKLCASLKPDNPEESDIYCAAMFIYGTLFCDNREGSKVDKEKAKKAYSILHDLAKAWGLVEDEPKDILSSVVEKLQSITLEQVRGMSSEGRMLVSGYASAVEQEATRIRTDVHVVENSLLGRGRDTELGGNGAKGRSTVGVRRS